MPLSDNNKSQLVFDMQEALERFMNRIRLHKSDLNEVVQLSDGQQYVLLSLSKKETCRASDIARQLGVTSGAVTGLTDKLVEMGLLQRERCDDDRRVVLLSLTDAGKQRVEKIQTSRSELLQRYMLHLEDDDMRALIRALNVMASVDPGAIHRSGDAEDA